MSGVGHGKGGSPQWGGEWRGERGTWIAPIPTLALPLLSTPLLGKTDDRGGAEIAAEDMIRRRGRSVGALSSSVLSRYKMIT